MNGPFARARKSGASCRSFAAMLIAASFPATCGEHVLAGQQQIETKPSSQVEPGCRPCHSCAVPTNEDLCLRPCLWQTTRTWEKRLSRKQGPRLVILNQLEDLYLPVPFDHEGHANMAEMTRGCTVCHHYTPEGAAHPACKSCHEASPVREDMRKPSLKAAYHRQCLSCHREWSHETACEVCHPPKTGRRERRGFPSRPTKDDIMGRMHPPIPEPEVKVYQTKDKSMPGTTVLFRHKEHIHRFGFTCAQCHHEDNCSRCHEEGDSQSQRVKTLEEHHSPCVQCHDMEKPNKCDHCHRLEGKPGPAPFDHAGTGWPLNRYHQDNNCRSCHKVVPFVKLDKDCQACHADWVAGTFDHSVTGQQLDDTHAKVDCEECHIGLKLDRPPTCDECHEEGEGVVFPANRPGSVVAPLVPRGVKGKGVE